MSDPSEPRVVRWSVAWHGYVRESVRGDLVREQGTDCKLEVYEDGNWIICGGDGCVLLSDNDPGRFERLASCLLGRPPTGEPGR